MQRSWLLIGILILAVADSGLAQKWNTGEILRPFFMEESESFIYQSHEDDHGGFYVTWTHEAAPHHFSLASQHVSNNGAALWDQTGAPVAADLSSANDWDSFPDGQGGLIITWVEGGRTHVKRLGPDGKNVWPDPSTITNSTSTCSNATGVADVRGGAYLVWAERRYPDRSVLMAQHVDPEGKLGWTSEAQRVSQRPSDQRLPRAVFDGQGGVIVAWNDFRENASQLQVQRLDSQGTRLWGGQGVVVTAPTGIGQDAPILAPLGGGSAVVAWVAQQSGVSRLFLQSVDAAGHFHFAPQGLNITYGSWDQWNPVLLGDGHGSIWSGWEDYRNHFHWQVFAGNLDQNAHIVWPGGEVALGAVTSDQAHLAIVDDGRKGVFAVWLDNRAGGSGLYAQEVDAQGQLLLGERGRAIAEGMTHPSTPKIVNVAPGKAAIFWADRQKKGRWALYWSSLSGPNTTPPLSRSPKNKAETDSSSGAGAGEGSGPVSSY